MRLLQERKDLLAEVIPPGSPKGLHGLITQPSPSVGRRSLPAEEKVGERHQPQPATPKGLHFDIIGNRGYATPSG